MKPFLDQDFLLHSPTAQQLYHDYAKPMPIIDYHCHLPPHQIAADKKFANLTEAWLYGDHYKWRAMRTNGVAEQYCTGEASDEEKFQKYAETVPYTLRNPLFHWTHLELQRYFGIHKLLSGDTARQIYQDCTEQLQEDRFSCRNILLDQQVKVVCTTDDPIDSLDAHRQLQQDDFGVRVLPTFRADKALAVDDTEAYNRYLEQLEQVADTDIETLQNLLDALQKRHDYFQSLGCRLSDHGLEYVHAADFTMQDADRLFQQVRNDQSLSPDKAEQLKSAILYHLALMDHTSGWTQQFHLGALRNNSTRMVESLGPDTGFDSIGDFSHAQSLARFFDRLDRTDQLTQTIVYNINPRDNYLIASMMGNFNDGSVAGKMQFGSGWWFLDQKEGMEWQINALSNLGLLSRFVGMLTDSRSFLSFPRHEYFRRILCNLLGNDVEKGELPSDIKLLGSMVQNICYHNAKNFFQFEEVGASVS